MKCLCVLAIVVASASAINTQLRTHKAAVKPAQRAAVHETASDVPV